MRVRQTSLMRVLPKSIFVLFLTVGANIGLHLSEVFLYAQIPATEAFNNSPVCSASDLGNAHDEARANPEWKPVNGVSLDPTKNPTPSQPMPILNDQPTILEGFVAGPPLPPVCLNVLGQFTNCESSKDGAPSEVAEEDIPWSHYTHDFTVKVVPDTRYQNLLSSWVRFPGVTIPNEPALTCAGLGGSLTPPIVIVGTTPVGTCVVPPEICPDGSMGTTCSHLDMEVEWENASLMDEGEGFQRIWGAIPEFVWPAVNDRVWVAGRWIFDCGHPNPPAAAPVRTYVKYSTEIHPPRALVTFRLNHPALDSFPVPRTSAPNFPFPQSYLPVTGEPTTVPPGQPNSGPTNVPVTEADVYVSGNGGGANDLCMILALHGSNCVFGHTFPVIPVNDRNYVFDIYPPGTNYHSLLVNGTFKVTPPVPDASLQWRIVDHSSELPTHACGGTDPRGCLGVDPTTGRTIGVTVDPKFCLIDASTPPPDQTETGCPSVPAAHPTRLRVILPFNGTNANFFAQSILLGWDDVPRPPTGFLSPLGATSAGVTTPIIPLGPLGTTNPIVRTFKVTLHAFTVVKNGESFLHNGDWRVFVNVGGQYRYIDPFFDRKPDGSNKCHGDALTSNGDGDCFLFDQTPWIVSVQDGTPIHVAVGGWESDKIDSDFCRQFPAGGGCHPFKFFNLVDLATANNDRIGTYEFDLKPPAYNWILPDGSSGPSFTTAKTNDGEQYKVEFRVQEIPAATAPSSAPLGIGRPNFGQFVSSATPLTLSTASADAEGFQYRSHLQGGPLPAFPSTLPFPVHWTHADLPAGSNSVAVRLKGVDGPYFFQFSAETFGNLLEPRHTAPLTLDNTPPVISIVQPQTTTYPHCGVLTLNYSISDGAGSGVNQFTSSLDGSTTLFGHSLASGQAINLLTELKLGAHTFSITAVDNVDNTRTSSVTFTIIVTPDSIKCDVRQFLQSGAIKNPGKAKSLLAKLDAAAAARARGRCSTAANIYQAFINELKAQSGKGVAAAAAAIMIADAQYLISHCP